MSDTLNALKDLIEGLDKAEDFDLDGTMKKIVGEMRQEHDADIVATQLRKAMNEKLPEVSKIAPDVLGAIPDGTHSVTVMALGLQIVWNCISSFMDDDDKPEDLTDEVMAKAVAQILVATIEKQTVWKGE